MRANLNLKINSLSLKVRNKQAFRQVDIFGNVLRFKILFIDTEANDEKHPV